MLKFLFWLSIFGALFSYLIYPAVLKLLPSRTVPASDGRGKQAPKVSLIITVHNEEGRIRDKIANTLELSYPGMEVIVASDASTDGTDQIVTEFRNQGVMLVRANERKGKEYAQLQAIKVANGEILVFSDVATSIPEDSLERLVAYFSDPGVGAVSSEDRFVSRDGTVAGEGAYVRYEMWLRRLESQRAGLVGLSGSFFAVRREICDDWDIYSPSDFNTALSCVRHGYIAVTAPDVLGFYQDVSDVRREYQRKLRTIIRGLTAMSRHPEVLDPTRYGWFAFQVFGHKLMRWAVPWFLVSLLLTSLVLAGTGSIYLLALIGQLAFYGVVGVGMLYPSLRQSGLVKLPYFFVQVNLAIAHATLSFLGGKRMTVWQPSRR
ncbi:glycosyltransferase family 2 protein [Marinobacter pelagius]|uniref:glycosyltransferase family 2 protein n=1 Tax=Marinobacter sp. C7 TaxID=2951363 RepID=UPI001EF11D97|nr:glycosyltransferase family 2 protein [Marinobacter sp. C7]MCG7199476.1 glycosyltransferase family 2 protein [Marinobacter sp. C7]